GNPRRSVPAVFGGFRGLCGLGFGLRLGALFGTALFGRALLGLLGGALLGCSFLRRVRFRAVPVGVPTGAFECEAGLRDQALECVGSALRTLRQRCVAHLLLGLELMAARAAAVFVQRHGLSFRIKGARSAAT